MILGLQPGDQVALEHRGAELIGRFVRMGRRDEQVLRLPNVGAAQKVDAAIVELDDGDLVAHPWCDLERPGAAAAPARVLPPIETIR